MNGQVLQSTLIAQHKMTGVLFSRLTAKLVGPLCHIRNRWVSIKIFFWLTLHFLDIRRPCRSQVVIMFRSIVLKNSMNIHYLFQVVEYQFPLANLVVYRATENTVHLGLSTKTSLLFAPNLSHTSSLLTSQTSMRLSSRPTLAPW
jgi:hypothetical protein